MVTPQPPTLTLKLLSASQVIDLGTVGAVGAHSPEVSGEAVSYPPGLRREWKPLVRDTDPKSCWAKESMWALRTHCFSRADRPQVSLLRTWFT